jgi:hypothetical protein
LMTGSAAAGPLTSTSNQARVVSGSTRSRRRLWQVVVRCRRRCTRSSAET